MVSAGSSGPSRRYSCVHWTILPVRSDRPGEPSQLPPLLRKETEAGEEGSESEEEGRVDLNLLMDGRDSVASVDLGDGGLGQVPVPLNINRRITQPSLSDAGEVVATERLLEKSNTIKKAQEDISVDDSAVTYTETETEEPAQPSRVRKYFQLPKLEFRDHVPFHPPAHSVGAPRHPRHDSDSVDPDTSSRRESSTHPSTADLEPRSPSIYEEGPPVSLKRYQTLKREDAIEPVIHEVHPAAVSTSPLPEHHAPMFPRPNARHVPGSYRSEYAPTPLAEEVPARESTPIPKDLTAMQRLRSTKTRPSTPQKERQDSYTSLRSEASNSSLSVAPLFSPASLLSRGSNVTPRHPLLKASMPHMSIDRGLPVSTVLTAANVTPSLPATTTVTAVPSVAGTTQPSRRESMMPPLTRSRRNSSIIAIPPTQPAAAKTPVLSASTSVASLRQLFCPVSPAYSHPGSPKRNDNATPASVSVYSEQSQVVRDSGERDGKSIESPDQSRRVSTRSTRRSLESVEEREEVRTRRIQSVVPQSSAGHQEVTVSTTQSVTVSKPVSNWTSNTPSIHTAEPVEVRVVHTLQDDLILTPPTVSALAKSPTKTPGHVNEPPAGGYRHMVSGSIYEAAKRAEAYLHGHDVRSEEQLAEKTPLPQSKASTQPQSNLSTQPQSKASTRPVTRQQSQKSIAEESDTDTSQAAQDAAVLILSASGKNSRQLSGAEHRRPSETPSNYTLMAPLQEASTWRENDYATPDFSGFESTSEPSPPIHDPMPREMDMSTPMPQPAKSPAKTPRHVDEHVPGYREMVSGTIYDAAMRVEAYLHGRELRMVEPVPVTPSSGAHSKASTQPQSRHTSRSHSMVLTSPSKTIPEDEIVPLQSQQTSFTPPGSTSPMKSATVSPPRRPSSVVSSISAVLSRAKQSNPSYERLPANLSGKASHADDSDGYVTDAKENEHKDSGSWKTVSTKSLPKPPQPLTLKSKQSSTDRMKSRTSFTEAATEPATPVTAIRSSTREPTPTPTLRKTSATEQFAKGMRSMSTDPYGSGEVTPTLEKLQPRPALGEHANSATAVSELLDKSRLKNKDKHHRTVHWLKELLSSQGSSPSTQLTAMPLRKHRGSKGSRGSRGSVHITMPPPEPHDITAIRDDLKKSHEESGEAFNKTIEDLESLLSEALQIARDAAEKDEGHVRRFSESLNYGGDTAEGKSYGLPGARPRLRSVASAPLSLTSIHESGGSSSSSSFVSHPSDIYPEQYHSAVRATSGATHGIVVQNVVVDEGPTWRRLPAPLIGAQGRDRRGSVAVGMPKPASKTEFRNLLMNPPRGNNNTARLRINSRGETRQVTAYMSNLAKDFPPPLAKRLSTIERRPSPLSYFTTDASSLLERDRPISPILKHPNVDFDSILAANAKNNDLKRSRSEKTSSRTSKIDPLSAKSSAATKRGVKALIPSTMEVKNFISEHNKAPIPPRKSSLKLRRAHVFKGSEEPEVAQLHRTPSGHSAVMNGQLTPSGVSMHSLDGPGDADSGSEIEFVKSRKHKFNSLQRGRREGSGTGNGGSARSGDIELMSYPNQGPEPMRSLSGRRMRFRPQSLQLRGLSHVSLDKRHGFSLARSHKRQPIARDWSTARKRFSATIACISTGLIGVLIGIYAGMVPSIQYYIADFHHYAILGNVFFYIGLAIPTVFFWPLPLLHGRKPYILASLALAMPLLFPQAVAVSSQRSPYVANYRVGLILPRAFMGMALGFANMNFHSILTDLFGASLQSSKPHQELVTMGDVRRHGGGLGVWLGIWTWCYVGSIGFGFLIGASIINTLSPDWGFYVCIIIIAAVLLLNVITPEVRRSAYRRSVTEVRTKDDISRRLARGEVMMHRVQTGPKWWGEEVYHGIMLSAEMLRQPGFAVMALYVGWTYAQVVLVIVLLGSLMSKYYKFASPSVGGATMAIPIGALLAVPFQKASLLSRSRKGPQRTDSMTFDKRVTWSSHLIRRSIFTLTLPFAGLAYTLASEGPPTPFILPILFAGLIGFLSSLAVAECTGIIMETFDTSDLQPGMTGRPRGPSGERTAHKRTNYSSFPRVSSAMGICQGIGFLLAAAATGVGGGVERRIGQRAATGVMAGILLVLTVLLLCVLIRWKDVQIIPDSKRADMERYENARRRSVNELAAIAGNPGVTAQDFADRAREVEEEEEMWRPVIIGNPSGTTRRVSLLELGGMSRWSEIRRKNKLVDEGLEARHPNLAAMGSIKGRLREKEREAVAGLSRRGGSLKDRTREKSDHAREALGARVRSTRSYMSGTEERRGVTLTDGPSMVEEGEQSEGGMTTEDEARRDQEARLNRLPSQRGGYDRV